MMKLNAKFHQKSHAEIKEVFQSLVGDDKPEMFDVIASMVNLFDEAKVEIFKLMSLDSHRRFVKKNMKRKKLTRRSRYF